MNDELAGLTRQECPVDCSPDRCVITRVGICGHPSKGGLQGGFLGKPDVVARYQQARKVLAHANIDARHGPDEPAKAAPPRKKARARRRKRAQKPSALPPAEAAGNPPAS